MNKVLDGIEVSEFEQLIEQFIESEDPYAMSFEALDEAIHEQLDMPFDDFTSQQVNDLAALKVELTGMVRDGQIIFERPMNAPILVHGNELVIGGLHLIVNLRPESDLETINL